MPSPSGSGLCPSSAHLAAIVLQREGERAGQKAGAKAEALTH